MDFAKDKGARHVRYKKRHSEECHKPKTSYHRKSLVVNSNR
nr:MAG TPA: hypothetical protein [Caudoviricetes sp.]